VGGCGVQGAVAGCGVQGAGAGCRVQGAMHRYGGTGRRLQGAVYRARCTGAGYGCGVRTRYSRPSARSLRRMGSVELKPKPSPSSNNAGFSFRCGATFMQSKFETGLIARARAGWFTIHKVHHKFVFCGPRTRKRRQHPQSARFQILELSPSQGCSTMSPHAQCTAAPAPLPLKRPFAQRRA
jgi:hypothetical protein